MADQIYQVVLTWNCAGQFAQNVLHWKFDDAGFTNTVTAGHALIAAFAAQAEDPLINMLAGDVELLSYKARRVTGGGGFEAITPLTPPNAGDFTGLTQASGQAPIIIGYPTDMTDRSRFKMFLPGVPIDACVDGKYVGVYKIVASNTISVAFDDLTLTGGGAPVAQHVLYSPNPATALRIISYRLSDTIGTLRRRQKPV